MRKLNTLIIYSSLLLSAYIPAHADNTLSFSGSEAATIGVLITDISSGETLAATNSKTAMTPASILKCVTTASALHTLGPEFTFSTPVYIDGSIDNDGTLHGNIIIKACGDPTIDCGRYSSHPGFVSSIASALKSAGVSRISGGIIIDDNNMPDQGQPSQWLIEDTAWEYGAGFYAMNYAGNTYRLNISTMTSNPTVPDIEVETHYANESTDMVRGVNSDLLIITGRNVNNKNYTVTTTMDNPSDAVVIAIENALQRSGITVIGNEETGGNGNESLLLNYHSPKASAIMADLMRRSDNLMAEGILRAQAPNSTRASAITVERNTLSGAGIDLRYTKLTDGSGLARVNRISPQTMTDVLQWMAKGRYSSTYTSFFPRAGREGTVRKFLKGTRLEGQLALKSGSMNGVHCYAGYKVDNNGTPTHTVVIMVNNFFCSRDEVRNAIQRLLLQFF